MIQAYHINRLYECHLTGNVLAEVTFALHEEPRTFLHPLSSIESAKQYIDREARDWFMKALEDYLNHKKQIINASHPELEAKLTQCWAAYEKFQKIATNTVCQQFLKGFEHFEAILPHPNNSSRQSSEHNLFELKKFCEQFLQFKPL